MIPAWRPSAKLSRTRAGGPANRTMKTDLRQKPQGCGGEECRQVIDYPSIASCEGVIEGNGGVGTPRKARGHGIRQSPKTERLSGKRDVSASEVDTHNLSTEEVQAEQAIDTRARGKCMCQHGKLVSLLPQRPDGSYGKTRSEFNSAARGNLYPLWRHRRVISDSRQWCNVYHGPGGARVQRQTQNDAPGGTRQFGVDDNQTVSWLEGGAHRTTAVSSGISPV